MPPALFKADGIRRKIVARRKAVSPARRCLRGGMPAGAIIMFYEGRPSDLGWRVIVRRSSVWRHPQGIRGFPRRRPGVNARLEAAKLPAITAPEHRKRPAGSSRGGEAHAPWSAD